MNKLAPEKREVLEFRIKAKFAVLAVMVWFIYGVYALIFIGQIKGIWLCILYFFVGTLIAITASIFPYFFDYCLNFLASVMLPVLGNIGGYKALIIKTISFTIQVYWTYIVAQYFISFMNNYL